MSWRTAWCKVVIGDSPFWCNFVFETASPNGPFVSWSDVRSVDSVVYRFVGKSRFTDLPTLGKSLTPTFLSRYELTQLNKNKRSTTVQ